MNDSPARIPVRFGLLSSIVAVVVALLLAPAPALAAEPTLEVLQVGWDGLVAPGSWSPVRVRLIGSDADVSGRVEVVTKARIQSGRQSAPVEYPTGAFGQEVALPAGVAKEVTLWVPSGSDFGGPVAPAGAVRLVASGRTLAEERIEFKTAKTPVWPVIGVLADSPSVARAIGQVELPVQGLPVPLSPARLAAGDLPASSELLGALSALVVQGNAGAILTGEQRTAIREWVLGGGHLVLSGGSDAPRAAAVLPAGILPLTFSGADGSADLSPLAAWAGVRDALPSGGPASRFKAEVGSPLAGTADRPLAWRMGLGQGTVTILAVDPGLEPLATWSGTPSLLLKALEPAIPAASEMDDRMRLIQAQQRDMAVRLQGAVDALPPEAFPGWETVVLVLGGFVLLVGPLLHFVLWRTDRRVWAWAAVPAAALLLAGGLFYAGVGREGRDVLVNVVSHVRLDPASGVARQTVVAGFFAPTRSDLTVQVPGEAAVRPMVGSGHQPYSSAVLSASASAASFDPPYRVVGGRDTRVEFASGQWGMRSVALSRALDGAGSLAASLTLDGGLVKGSIRNDTPYPLEDAVVLMGQGVAKLGSLAPGQTAQVVLDPGPPANPFRGARFPISWRILGRPASSASPASGALVARSISAVAPGVAMPAVAYPGMPEQMELPQDPEVQRRVRLLDPVVNVPRMGPSAQSMPLSFIAFTRAPVGAQLPDTGGHPTFYLTLFEQSLALDLPDGPFTMPPAMSPGEIIGQSGGLGAGGDGAVSWIQVQGGSVIYSFRPPLPVKAEVDALVLTTQQLGQSVPVVPGRGMGPPSPNAQPGPAEPGVFSVYNWQAAAWEPLPGGEERARLEPAARYIGPGGEVRMQVTAAADRAVMFVQPELTVEGRVAQ